MARQHYHGLDHLLYRAAVKSNEFTWSYRGIDASKRGRTSRKKNAPPLVAVSALLAIASAAHAQDVEPLSPAALGTGEQSLANVLRTPFERPSGIYDVTLRCQVIVEPDGSTRSPRCLTLDRFSTFREETERALTSATMVPARLDGEPVRVLMNLIVGFRCAETCPAFLFSNHGRNVAEYGFRYTAPQPVLDDDQWYSGFEWEIVLGREFEICDGGRRNPVRGFGARQRVRSNISGTCRGWVQGFGTTELRQRSRASLRDRWVQRGLSRVSPGASRLRCGYSSTGSIQTARRSRFWSCRSERMCSGPIVVPALDSSLSDEQVREMFVAANEYWQPAAIEWELDAIVETQAERQLAFRRTVVDDTAGTCRRRSGDVQADLSQCRLEAAGLECLLRARVAEKRFVFQRRGRSVSRRDGPVAGTEIPPFALAHVLGHMLGLPDRATMRGNFHAFFWRRATRERLQQPEPMGPERRSDHASARLRRAPEDRRPKIVAGRGMGGMRR